MSGYGMGPLVARSGRSRKTDVSQNRERCCPRFAEAFHDPRERYRPLERRGANAQRLFGAHVRGCRPLQPQWDREFLASQRPSLPEDDGTPRGKLRNS